MNPVPVLGALLLAVGVAHAQAPNSTKVSSTVTLHDDNTRTDSVKDLFKREMVETTYDARGVVIAKKKFLLGDSGDPVQGAVYDGADNVIARVQFYFDDLGRVIEERCSNTQGEVFQRVIRQYDISGKPLPPQVINLPVKSPTMRPSKVNYTQSAPPPARSSTPVRPGQGPQIETVSPGSRTTLPTSDPAQPPNLRVPVEESSKEDPKKRSKLNPFNWFKKDK